MHALDAAVRADDELAVTGRQESAIIEKASGPGTECLRDFPDAVELSAHGRTASRRNRTRPASVATQRNLSSTATS